MALFGGLKDIPVDGELNFCGTIRRILEVFEYWGYSYPARCEGNPRRKRLYIIWGVILNLLTICKAIKHLLFHHEKVSSNVFKYLQIW